MVRVKAARHIKSRAAVSLHKPECRRQPDQIGKIFEPLYTDWPSRTGMGLGLSLARDIVDSMGGQISVVSQPGKGATFTIRIPEEK